MSAALVEPRSSRVRKNRPNCNICVTKFITLELFQLLTYLTDVLPSESSLVGQKLAQL